MTILKKLSVNNENKSLKYSIFICDNFIDSLEMNFSKALKEKKIYISDFRRFEVISIKANDFYKIGKNLIKSDPLSLIKGQRI